MKICFFGWENLSVLAPEFNSHGIGGEQVQHTLLAKALVQRGHEVSMVVLDYGQPDGAHWHGVTTYKTFRPDAGIPIVRYIYPRWTSVWSALERADADVYYVSCAGMHVGLLAIFCRLAGRRFMFRIAHDTDCEPDRLMIEYWRDKKFYAFGLKRADGIFAQSAKQQRALLANYGLQSEIAEMMVDRSEQQVEREIDVLWVNNLRQFKRPDLFLSLARLLPQFRFHMVGGTPPGFDALFEKIKNEAVGIENLTFYGHVPYREVGAQYARARVFVNTSDSEGFPNSYLQAWVRGTPVVAFFDPDGVIRQERLGAAVTSPHEMANAITELLNNQSNWLETSCRCKNYMARRFDDERILAPYLKLFQRVV